ncbi:MAG: hypothetical protein ACLS9K_03430 [Lachnospira eligens]
MSGHGIYPNGDNGPVPLKVIYEGNKKRLAITYKAHPQSYEDQKIYYFDEVELNQKFTISIQIIDGTVMFQLVVMEYHKNMNIVIIR